MHKRKKIRFAIFAIAAVMLLTAIGGHGQDAAWMQGYTTGIAAAANAASEGTTVAAPMAAHAQMGHHGMHGGLWVLGAIVGGIFKFAFFLLMFAFFAKMFGFLMWRLAMGGGPSWGGDGHSGWNRDEMRKKWRDRKRAWAKERGYDISSFTDASHGGDGHTKHGHSSDSHNNDGHDDRPAEERFVV